MMGDQTPHERLIRWLDRKVAAGVPSDDLPSPEDLRVLAAKGVDPLHPPLENRDAVRRYRDELQQAFSGETPQQAPSSAIDLRALEREAPGESAPAAVPAVAGQPDPQSFAAHELDDGTGGRQPAALRSVNVVEGGLRYRWAEPAPSSGVRLYRVVARDDHMPFSPDDADSLLAVTEQPEAIDRRPMTAAVRYVQIWLNEGPDERRARQAQPVLLAQDHVVAPAAGVHIVQDGSQVTGEWTVRPGVRRVDVYRLPAARAHDFSNLQYQVTGGGANLGGFIDEELRPGAYLYRVYAVAQSDDGAEVISAPVIRPLEVLAPLSPVTDLRIVSPPGTQSLTLEWTAPLLGEVQIYRTDRGPGPGVSESEIPADAVNGSAGLPAEQRMRREIESDGAIQRLTRVTVPAATATQTSGRLYFTPVTVYQDRAWIGRPVIHYRFGEILSPWLVQRVDWQLVSFGWPAGATMVFAHVTPTGEPVRRPLEGSIGRIDQEEYRLQGGLVLRGVLPPGPCDVHLTPVLGGPQSVAGRTVTLHYPGLIRVWYQMPKKLTLRRERAVSIHSDSDVRSPLRFIAVHRRDRLPLSLNDGDQISQWFSALRSGEWLPLGEVAPPKAGFVRIFIDLPDAPVDIALIDPSVDQLKW